MMIVYNRVNFRVSGTLNGVMIVEQDLHCYIVIVYNRVYCRVSGTLNGVMIVEQDLHCYIVTADGRTYTAISRISPDIGWDIQVKTKNPFSSLSEVQIIQKRCVVSI